MRKKILIMMISICAASALFAEDYLFAFDKDGTVRQVTKDGDNYKFKDGKIAYSPTFILGQNFGNGGFTFGYNLTPYRSNIGSSIAIGSNTKATQEYAIAFGYDTESAGKNAVAIGKNTKANNENAIAIGHQATVVVVDPTKSTPAHAIAIGSSAKATSVAAIALGRETTASNGQAIAIGDYAKSSGTATIAIGDQSEAAVNKAIAIGHRAKADKRWSIAFGLTTEAKGESSIAIGQTSKALEKQSVAIGYGAKSSGENAFAFGSEAEAEGLNSLAFSTNSKASGANSNAIGLRANASGENSNAIGVNSFATGKNSIAIGSGGAQYAQGEGSIAIGSAAYTLDKHSISIGTLAQTLGNGYSIAIGNQSLAKKENTIAIGSKAKALDDYASAIGTSAEADNSATALGYQAKAKGTSSTAFGADAKALGRNSVAIGSYSNIAKSADYSVSIGTLNDMKYKNSVAIGYGSAIRDGGNSVVLGYNATTSLVGSKFTTLGADAQSRTTGSVALGYGSWADRGSLSDNPTSTGARKIDVYLIEKGGNNEIDKDGEVAKTVANTMGAVSVGSSSSSGSAGIFTRQIINVAAGSQDTDAVNVAQLKALNDKFSNQGLKFKTNYVSYPASSDTIISKKLGETLNIVGGESIKNRIGIDDFSGENIATSNNGGEVGLMMKRKPKFDGISFVKDSQDGNPIKIEKSNDTTLTFLSQNGKNTKLTNIAAGTADTDAVNVSQLIKSSEENRIKYFSVKSDKTGGGSNYDNDGAKGQEAVAIGPNAIVETNAASSVALGDGAKVEADAESAIAIGHKASAKKTNSIAIGSNTKSGDSSVAIGLGSKTGEGVIDKASYKKINKELNNVKRKYEKAKKLKNQEKMAEFGKRRDELEELLKTYDARYEYNGKLITKAEYDKLSQADKKKAIIKYMSSTMYKNSVAIGHDAQALANDAVAIGNGAKVIVDGSKKIVAGGGVAIGQGSVSNAREDKDLKGYRPKAFSIDENSNAFKNNKSAWIATNQPFAVGDDRGKEKITRQITGVAAGTKDTDAVNVAQLKQVGFFIQGDIGGKGRIQNEDEYDNDTLNIKTDDNWKNDRTNIVYTGRNLETKSIPADGSNDPATKKPYTSRIKIAMTDTPRFKSITIANDDAVNGLEDNSPIELKKFDDKTNNNTIGFAGKGDSTIKLTNLSDGNIAKDSTDAVTGKQLYEVQEKTNTLAITPLKFADNNNNIIERKLGNTLRISGGQNADIKEDDFTIGENIGVFKKYNDNLAIALAKNLKNITSISNGDKGAKITLEKDNKNIFVNGAKITNVAEGDITKDSTDAVNGKQLYEVKNELKNNLNSKVSDVIGKNNIKVESKGTEKIVSLKENIDLTNNGSIKFGDGKTDITKDKITSKDLVATNGTNKVTISGDDGTITGLTNTTWDKNNIVENRAATEGQLKELQENFTTNLNGTVNQTLGKYKLKGDEGRHNIYGNETLTIKGDKNIKTKATEDGNLDIKLSKKLNLKDGSITFDKTKLDEDGLKVGDDVKITKDTIQNGDVKLTKDGLNNGGNKITKVADGKADDDAATVGQLKNIAVGASGVKESDKKDDWAKEKPKATGKNSVSIAGGSKDNGRSNTVSVGAPGHERTISNVAPGVLNSDAATVGQLKAGLNNVYGKLDEYKKDSRAGTASAMAIGNLPQSTIPGKGMVSLGGGFYDGESAMAIGLSKMSDDGKWVVKGSASYDSQENAGAAVSVGFHF